jgi:ComF family protein
MKAITAALNLLFPPQCSLCRVVIEQAGAICGDCWQELHFISDPQCKRCGYPHEYEMGQGAECAACLANPPEYYRHRSVLYFDEVSKKLVHDLKYYDNALMVESFARWMKRIAPEWLAEEGAIIAPVPIHRYRLWQRKYNQSALLASALAKVSQREMMSSLLHRVKHLPPQASLSRQKRLRNVGSAFRVNPNYREVVKDRPVILIDDVMTTGATINACAKQLNKAGAGRVYCITLARTLLD